MMTKSLNDYLSSILQVSKKGDTREESYYDLLKQLIYQAAEHLGKSRLTVTTMPRKTEAGNPDFRVWDGKSKIIGYIEAKRPETDLDAAAHSEQVERYIDTFPNFILTNFLEFRFYRDGVFIEKAAIGRQHTLVALGAKPALENESKFLEILEKFFSFTFPRTLDARRLAAELAKRTRFLRDQVVIEELKEKSPAAHNHILGFYTAFKKYLIIDLDEKSFADLYSQTITYGLFAARTRCPGEFSRENALKYIPQTIGILHDIFEYISIGRTPEQLAWIVDDIAEVLASIDVGVILQQFYREGKGEDPIVHFYETFLSEYDPRLRKKRGVYYTPAPVVSFIVRSVNRILKEKFHRPDGLADTQIKVLDPAAGTLTFVAEAIKLALQEYTAKYGAGVKEQFIRSHLLQNFYAFELMMAPYAVGHLKMSYVLGEMDFRLPEGERFKLYLTNTLEMQEIEQADLPGISTLSDESRLAGEIKKKTPILVILGNPPYAGISLNMGPWITEEIEKYKYVDGRHFAEKKHWLHDDYVKFIRFAQWKIDQNGEGVLGFITNHSYLDNPTFRGMRQSLMKTFNEIYILDLHGNSLKKECCPDGSKDENVFDIRQGVAISLFVKTGKIITGCNVYHSEQWGLRDDKYDRLSRDDVDHIDWETLNPRSPYYFFIPKAYRDIDKYNSFTKITEIFPVNVTGIVTARDKLVIDSDKDKLVKRLEMFRNLSFTDEMIKDTFDLKDTRGWKLKEARQKLNIIENLDAYITRISYRPFDERFIYLSIDMVDWPRPEVTHNMINDNIGILFTRPKSPNFKFSILVSNFIIDQCVVGNKTAGAGISYLASLYIYPDNDKKDLFNHSVEDRNRRPNIAEKIFQDLQTGFMKQGKQAVAVTPENIFYYIYAVLYSNIYREKYVEFLRIDFPRVPFTTDYGLFIELGKLGRALVDIHLMKSPELEQTFSRFEVPGSNQVEKVEYKDDCVYINKEQYFSGIQQEIWEYQVGGYQVMNKWLKDRKGQGLTLPEIRHYIRIARALELTGKYQLEIDRLYPGIEESLPAES